jgi:hypothetical protein
MMTSMPDAVLSKSVICDAGRRPTGAPVHKLALLLDAKHALIDQFKALANDILEEKSKPAAPRISLPASIYILDVRVVTQLRVANSWEAHQIVKRLEFDHAVVE